MTTLLDSLPPKSELEKLWDYLTPPEQEELAALLEAEAENEQAPREWIEANLKIRTKAGDVVPFRYNPIQVRLDEIVDELRAQGRLVRIIVLKARQEGVSTWAEARGYEYTRRNRYRSATIIGNDLENSQHLYGMYELFYERDESRLPTKKSNRKGLEYEPPHGSDVLVTTAIKANAGTGHTNQFLHMSEVAKWRNAKTTLLSLLQTLPETPDSVGIIESTAEGNTGEFKKRWDDAEAGRSEWYPVFFAWFDLPDYQMPVGRYPLDEFGLNPRYNAWLADPDAGVEAEEVVLRDTHGCSREQLTWRRWAIDNKCGGDVELFHQEYPSTPSEAFLGSGRPRFNVRFLKAQEGNIKEPVFKGTLAWKDDGHVASETPMLYTRPVELVPSEQVYVRIWEHPQPGEAYVGGADARSESGKPNDFSAASFSHRATRRQVATIHGHLESDEYAYLLCRLGAYFNMAVIGVEINEHGWAVLNTLRKIYPAPYLFHQLIKGETAVKPTKRVGWHTNSATKPLMIDALAAHLRDQSVTIVDRMTLDELYGYQHLEGGGTGADPEDPEAHDDLVIGKAIALQVANYSAAEEIRGYNRAKHRR